MLEEVVKIVDREDARLIATSQQMEIRQELYQTLIVFNVLELDLP